MGEKLYRTIFLLTALVNHIPPTIHLWIISQKSTNLCDQFPYSGNAKNLQIKLARAKLGNFK
jgi:hypothetical protein